ncbi:MAG: Spy/CpxP family protein refolding chaperone [Bryobacteraceae bacterium]|nr:Spy/CpxP family protein refolding chaperone [Bryobacteraceae bacterium]
MKIKNVVATVLIAAGVTVVPTFAGPGRMASGHGRHMGRMSAALSLTDAQKANAKQIFEDSKREAQPIAEQMRQVRADLEVAVKENNASAIASLSTRQGQLAGQLSEIRSRGMASFYAQLTPEQKAKAADLKQGRENRFEKRRGDRQQ